MPIKAKPTTARPITEPEKKPTERALARPDRAAQATRPFALVLMTMPA